VTGSIDVVKLGAYIGARIDGVQLAEDFDAATTTTSSAGWTV
jgi:hypothetical protein